MIRYYPVMRMKSREGGVVQSQVGGIPEVRVLVGRGSDRNRTGERCEGRVVPSTGVVGSTRVAGGSGLMGAGGGRSR